MAPMPDALLAAPVGWRGSSRYSTNQTAILTPLTSVSRAHHQDTGFDQAREPDRACHSKLIRRSAVIELTFNCNNTVTRQGQSRHEYGTGWGRCSTFAGRTMRPQAGLHPSRRGKD